MFLCENLQTTRLICACRNKHCEEEAGQMEQRIHSKITTIVLAIFFISLLGVGMGQTAVYTLGIPYIDDNVASRESPLYFGKQRPSPG